MTTAPTDHLHAMPGPQRRNFGLFLTSQVASQSGTWLQFVALAWLAAELTSSAATLGWVAVATFGPLLVLGPWTGTLADRVDKHRLLIASQILVVGQAVALGVLVLTGATTVAAVYWLTLVYGVIHAVETPVRRAFVAELVDEERIPHAVSLTSVIAAIGRVLGPLFAGALIAWTGIGWCFIANAVSYLIALAVLLPVHRGALHITVASREAGAVRAGLRYAWSVPELRIALLLTGVVATFGFNHQVLIPMLAHHTFSGGAGTYTLLYAAISAGSVLGALSVARRREIDLRFLAHAIIAFALANGLLAISPNLVLAVIAGFATGAAALLFVTAATTLLQQRCAPAMRGRVMALSAMVLLGAVPIGAPLIGWIADFAGTRTAVATGSVGALLAGTVVLRHLKSHNPNPMPCARVLLAPA
ncbi:MFS transporter [Mycobacterium sp. Y57]|uniref:MFS transporter n=1 Tax=Mycolicibacterium xanthum TaxID=2796469 RepID=UPI001C860857|nr:MFS transporter [Mycolicibacterium xanthum]MBX7434189.1 MFS transporter [Mycolicibacterium xanthum]